MIISLAIHPEWRKKDNPRRHLKVPNAITSLENLQVQVKPTIHASPPVRSMYPPCVYYAVGLDWRDPPHIPLHFTDRQCTGTMTFFGFHRWNRLCRVCVENINRSHRDHPKSHRASFVKNWCNVTDKAQVPLYRLNRYTFIRHRHPHDGFYVWGETRSFYNESNESILDRKSVV